jgi:hypothetical protein
VAELPKPGKSLWEVFGAVTARVRDATDGQQIPWKNDSLTRPYYLASAPSSDGDHGDVGAGPGPAAIEAALELVRDERRQVQRALNSLGHGVGPADGIFGPRTRKALAAYQRGQGLEPTGWLDAEQYKLLLALASVVQAVSTSRERLRSRGKHLTLTQGKAMFISFPRSAVGMQPAALRRRVFAVAGPVQDAGGIQVLYGQANPRLFGGLGRYQVFGTVCLSFIARKLCLGVYAREALLPVVCVLEVPPSIEAAREAELRRQELASRRGKYLGA